MDAQRNRTAAMIRARPAPSGREAAQARSALRARPTAARTDSGSAAATGCRRATKGIDDRRGPGDGAPRPAVEPSKSPDPPVCGFRSGTPARPVPGFPDASGEAPARPACWKVWGCGGVPPPRRNGARLKRPQKTKPPPITRWRLRRLGTGRTGGRPAQVRSAGQPDRHELMNFLRSSPVLPVACLLQ
jgi:hypothetical protein